MLSKRIELSSRFKTRAAISVLFFLAVIFFFLINLTDRTNQNKRSVYTRRIAAAVNDSELDSGHNGHEVTEEHQEEIPYVVLFPWQVAYYVYIEWDITQRNSPSR